MTTTPTPQTLMTDRGAGTATETGVDVVTLTPLQIIGVRAARTYMQSLLGLFLAANLAQATGTTPLLVGQGLLSVLSLAAVSAVTWSTRPPAAE